MKLKKALALILSALLATSLLAACGGGGSTSTPASSGAASSSTASGDAQPTGTDLSQQDPYTLNVYMFGDGDSAEIKLVEEALSAILKEKINADINLTILGFAAYVQQVNLALSSDEALDCFPILGMNMSSMADNGSIIPLDDLYAEYGTGMQKIIAPSDLDTKRIDGELFGIPVQTDGAFSYGILVKEDMAEELDIDPASMNNLDGIYDALTKAKEAYPDVYPLVSHLGTVQMMLPIDYLGDTNSPLGVLEDVNTDSLEVVNLFATDSFKAYVETMYQWAQEGLIMPEASSNTETDTSLFIAGKAFASFRRSGEPLAFKGEHTRSVGSPMVYTDVIKAYSTSDDIPVSWAIPNNSKDPARAMQFIDLAYSDPEIANLLCHGLEGRHYVFSEAGDDMIRYPDGKDAATMGYPSKFWGWPNQTISYIFDDYTPTMWEDRLAFVSGAKESPAKGFVFNNTAVTSEITACRNVLDKYYKALLCGAINPAEALPKFNQELEASGLNAIIAEKQAQLDAWAATR